MLSRQILGLLLGLCTAAACGSTASNDADTETETEAATTGTNTGQTANTSGSSSSLTTTQGVSASASVTTTTSGTTTGVGGATGNANATSETSTTAAGGSGGSGDDEPCPGEAPAAGSECSGTSYCVYEDCAGAGRSSAVCSEGAWSVSTTACSETFFCQHGDGQCNAGEICLIRAGGAFFQECVPNTCGTGPVECDCIEGCFDYCGVYSDPEQGTTVTCNTCTMAQCA